MLTHTSNLEGSNLWGSGKNSGLWWKFLNKGITFQPFGIKYPVINSFVSHSLKWSPRLTTSFELGGLLYIEYMHISNIVDNYCMLAFHFAKGSYSFILFFSFIKCSSVPLTLIFHISHCFSEGERYDACHSQALPYYLSKIIVPYF